MTKTSITESTDPTVAYAEQVVVKLQNDFLHVDEHFGEILRIKAWTILGYDSFATFWVEKFSGTVVGKLLFPMVTTIVANMLGEGTPVEEIAYVVDGVGPETVAWIKEQLDANVPNELLTTTPPKNGNSNGNGDGSLKVSFTVDAAAAPRWKKTVAALAKKNGGKTLSQIAFEQTQEYIDNFWDLAEAAEESESEAV